MSGKTIEKPDTSKWWACACVKRDRKGNMSHIKLRHPTMKKCRVCGATLANAKAIEAKGAGT